MVKITTGDLMRAIQPFFPPVSEDMILAWVDEGLLDAWRNPVGKKCWHFIIPETIEPFLREILRFPDQQTREVLGKLGVNFTQLGLELAA